MNYNNYYNLGYFCLLMEDGEIIARVSDYVKSRFKGDSSGHDWEHIFRVWKLSLKIAEEEKADLFVVQLAALLHDIADWKLSDNEEECLEKTVIFLRSLGVSNERIDKIVSIVRNVSFRGANVYSEMQSIEGKIVQDADRLDAIGAIGVARAFAYGGHKGKKIYDPKIVPKLHDSFEEYKNSDSTVINHFYEKLFLLKDRMHTETAKKIAEERQRRMEDFLISFFREWEYAE